MKCSIVIQVNVLVMVMVTVKMSQHKVNTTLKMNNPFPTVRSSPFRSGAKAGRLGEGVGGGLGYWRTASHSKDPEPPHFRIHGRKKQVHSTVTH